MAIINHRLLLALPEARRSTLVFYPDIILFDHNEHQYRQHWQKLANSKYLYSDGYETKPTNWLGYTFQSFKGWLGFTNHCRKELIDYSLQKLAFYGYLRGYNQQPLEQMRYFPLDAEFQQYLNPPCNPLSSAILQQALISNYVLHVAPFNQNSQLYPLTNNHVFGKSWADLNLWEVIPSLDPQHPGLVNRTMSFLEKNRASVNQYTIILPSFYAKSVASFYLEKAQNEKKSMFYGWNLLNSKQHTAHYYMEKALELDPEIYQRDIISFIEMYLEKKQYAKAIELIAQMADEVQVINYLINSFTQEQQVEYIKKDSRLGLLLAGYYLNKPTDTISTIALAAQFDSKLDEHNPVHAFGLLIHEKNYDQAFELFKKHPKLPYAKKFREQLASHFNTVGEEQYNRGHEYRIKNSWDKAKPYYKKSMLAKIKASLLIGDDKHINEAAIHQRLYAQLIIDADLSNNTLNLEDIEIAINLLEECKPKEANEIIYHQKALTIALMRKADYYLKQILVPYGYDDHFDIRTRHNVLHQKNFDEIQLILERVISILPSPSTPALQARRAKAHYILADMGNYFDLKIDYPLHYLQAVQWAPDNPFYLLEASGHHPQEKNQLSTRGIPKLKEMGYEMMDYLNWAKTRWEIDGYQFQKIRNIHELNVQPEVVEEEEESMVFGF